MTLTTIELVSKLLEVLNSDASADNKVETMKEFLRKLKIV